jgi:DNA polymerase-3 subunit gamma/tau
MSYIVLARKWRPQTFTDLVGQQHIAVTLRNAIAQNRVAHAFLFTGSRGVGKTSTARIFAKALNCEHFPCDEPCNVCQSCREITEGNSVDVREFDAASNRGIDAIREEVIGTVNYAPVRDRYKIYIIDEVHMLTTEAFNALLKTLEEPPPHIVFIFATTDPNKIPITIVSRCQRYDFKRIGIDDLVGHLGNIANSENIAFEEAALRLIARTARGGVRDALSAMDQIIAFAEQPIDGEKAAEVLGVASRETLIHMGEAVIKKDVAAALACIEKVDRYGQNLSQFAFDLLEFWRDVTVMAAAPGAPVELDHAEKNLVSSWLPLTTYDCLQRVFQIWYQTSEMLPKSLSPKLVMEMAAIRMCQVETVVPLDGILRKLDVLTKALSGSVNLAPDALEHIQTFLNARALGTDGNEKKN